jgi:SAM-dependent methyltransferase
MTIGAREPLSYNKVCNLEDFSHPALRDVLFGVFTHDRLRFGPEFPVGREDQKQWEIAMTVRTLRDHGLLDGGHQLLGVGVGSEPTIFYLTRFARRVFATDHYLDIENGQGVFTDRSMLVEPDRHWPFPWNPGRLVVQHMDATNLRYEDDSMDAVFASNAVERLNDADAVARCLDEIHRVLQPGGICSLIADFRVDGPPLTSAERTMFDGPEIFEHLVGGRDWLPVSSIDLRVPASMLVGVEGRDRDHDDRQRHVSAEGGACTSELDFERPQLMRREGASRGTSRHLAFRKAQHVATLPNSDAGHAPLRITGGERETRTPAIRPSAGTLGYSKVCNLEDFSHPQVREIVRDVFDHELERFGDDFPRGHEYRKYWEVAMAVRSFADHGLLDGRSELLGIGAGNEPTIFWLTRHAGRVFATDRYLSDDIWDASADVSMLAEPERHWPFAWNPRRLIVQHMDALDLHYEDASFDGVFSCSSLEHFGDLDGLRRSVSEMHRVLKPGGVLALSTEFLIAGPTPGFLGCWMFTVPLIYDVFFDQCSWELPSPIDFSVSPATLATRQDFHTAAQFQNGQYPRTGGHLTFKIEQLRYPHLVLQWDDHIFTSMHLTLRKR